MAQRSESFATKSSTLWISRIIARSTTHMGRVSNRAFDLLAARFADVRSQVDGIVVKVVNSRAHPTPYGGDIHIRTPAGETWGLRHLDLLTTVSIGNS